MIGKVLSHLHSRDLRVRAWMGIGLSFSVDMLLGKSFIDHYTQIAFSSKNELVPLHLLPVTSVTL